MKKQETDSLIINNDDQPAHETLTVIQIAKNTFLIAVPMALSFTFSLSQITSAVMAARTPHEDADSLLAATSLMTASTNFLVCISMSPLFSMGILASNLEGKMRGTDLTPQAVKKIANRIGGIYKSGMILSTFVAPFPMAAMYFSEFLLTNVFRQNPQISLLVQNNLRAYSFAVPAIMYRLCAEQMMFSFDKATPAMIIGWGSMIAGTALAVYLTFGSPDLGLAGIGYGYLAEAVLTCIGYNLYIARHPDFENIPFFQWTQSPGTLAKQAKKILAMGLPITLQMGCELSANLLTGIFAGWLGKDQLAAQNFSNQLAGFAVMTSVSFGQTVSQEVSRLVGKQDFINAERFARWGLATTMLITGAISTAAAAAPQGLIKILSMSVGPRAMNMAKTLIPMTAVQTLYDAAGYGMVQSLRAANDLNIPTLIKVSTLWLGVLLAFVTGFHTDLGIYGVGMGLMLGVGIGTLLNSLRWLPGTMHENLALESKKIPLLQAPEEKPSCCRFSFFNTSPNLAGDINQNQKAVVADFIPTP